MIVAFAKIEFAGEARMLLQQTEIMEDHWTESATEVELRDALREIDECDEVRCTRDEIKLIEQVVYAKAPKPFTEEVKACVIETILKYEDYL